MLIAVVSLFPKHSAPRSQHMQPDSNSPRGFTAGDPLRAMAALAVVVYHAAYFLQPRRFYSGYGAIAGHVLGSFHLGLFIFFVLSGYLISAPFVRAFVSGTPAPLLGRYAGKRLTRIAPAFWAILTIPLLAGRFFGEPAWRVAMVYGFAQNFSHGPVTHVIIQAWTLDVEVAFYVLVPSVAVALTLACRRLDRNGRSRMLIGALVVGSAASLAARAIGPHTLAWNTSLPAMTFAFIPGVAIAVTEATATPRRLRSRGSRVPAGALLAAGLGVLALYSAGVGGPRPPITAPSALGVLGFLLAVVGSGAVVAAPIVCQWSTGRCWAWLDNRVTRWIGARSYSLYLVHVIVIAIVVAAWPAVTNPGMRLVLLLPVMIAVSLAVATLSYRWFELPFLRLRWSTAHRGSTVRRAPVSLFRPVPPRRGAEHAAGAGSGPRS